MNSVALNIVLIFAFILVGGVFAAAEMALVSLRSSQVKQLAHRGSRGRAVARLNENPNRFLSAVQIGVTLAGFLSAAFGGAMLSDALAPVLARTFSFSMGLAQTIALVVITALISYVSIVIGELTAKRLALQRAEAFALALAPLVELIAKLARPVIWLLGVSTNFLVALFGGDPKAGRQEVSDEEIRALVSDSTTLGEEERRIVDDVFDAGARSLREVMLPRTEVDFLPGAMTVGTAIARLAQAPHSRYPVIGGSADHVIGFVHIRDLLRPDIDDDTPVADLAREVLTLPDTVLVLRALSQMRRTANHLAIVVDEYGGTAGIVTIEDLVEELIGDITDEFDVLPADSSTQRDDHIDGLTTLSQFTDSTGLVLESGPYDTVAGYFMASSGQIPTLDASLETDARVENSDEVVRLELTVAELDGRRAARFRLQRQDDRDATVGPEAHDVDQLAEPAIAR